MNELILNFYAHLTYCLFLFSLLPILTSLAYFHLCLILFTLHFPILAYCYCCLIDFPVYSSLPSLVYSCFLLHFCYFQYRTFYVYFYFYFSLLAFTSVYSHFL